MFDDHEIVNDYAPSRQDDDLYGEAMIPFHHYQMIANPAGIDKTERSYFTFNLGRVSFFVLDNRSYRSPQPARTRENSTAGWGDRTMLGARQMHHLRTWAAEEGDKEERLLVVVSGVPFTRNWSKGGDEFDSWAVSDRVGTRLITGLFGRARSDTVAFVGSRWRNDYFRRPARAW